MKTLVTFLSIILSSSLLYSQEEIYCDYHPPQSENQSFFDLNKGKTNCVQYGNAHTPKGNLHTMMVFITFTEDQNNTNAENNILFWPKNAIPTYASSILNLSPNTGPISTKSNNLSGFYETMSGYNSSSGFSVTGKVFHVTISKQFNFDPTKEKEINLDNFEKLLCQRTINALQTQYPNEDWLQYDKRDNINGVGTRSAYRTDNSALFSDGIIDYLSFNFRLLPSDLNIFRTGTGAVKRNGISLGVGMKDKFSLPDLSSNGQFFQVDCGHVLFDPFENNKFMAYFTHEFGHGVFGLQHHMGANNVTGFNYYAYYGWGMMADVSKFFNTSNAWENWTYGWYNPQVASPLNQTYTIKDFVTTKDAIKIPIPNTNQALWIENHQLINVFDNKNTSNLGIMTPGLYMYISDYESIDNCVILPDIALESSDVPYSRMFFWANRLKVLSKEGNKDYNFTLNNSSYNFIPQSDNPFSGVHSAQTLRIDMNQDGLIEYKSASANYGSNEHTRVYNLNGNPVANWSGNSTSAFGVGDELSLSGILPILNYTYVVDEQDRIAISNGDNPSKPIQLSPSVINGLRVNILGYNSVTREYNLYISFTDIELRNDKILAGRIELPDLNDVNVPDLILKTGKSITIKRSGTANTNKNSVQDNIINYAWPSKFTCKENSIFKTESNSNVIVKEQSEFILETGATLEIGNGSIFTVKENSSFKLSQNSNLIIKENGKLIIEDMSNFVYLNNSQIILEGSNSILEIKGGAKIQVGENAIFNYSGNGYIKIISNNLPYPVFEAIGDNARVKIFTKGFNFVNKKLLEITGGSLICDKNIQNSGVSLYELKELSFQNGFIQLDKNCGIAITGKQTKTDLRNLLIRARIENNINERHLGIILNGQKDNLVYRVTVMDAINGITSNNFYGGHSIDVLQYTAHSCDIALQINGVGARIQDNKINNCKTGIYLQGMYGSTRLYRGEIFNCSVGILAVNCGSTRIELYQANIYNNYNGIFASNSTFTGACGKIYNNASAVMTNGKYLGANVHLSTMGNLILDPTFRSGIGNLDLSNTRSVSIRLSNSSIGPLLSNSQSSLLTDPDLSIEGNINRSPLMIPININSNMNLWRNSGGTSVSPANNIDYKVIFSKFLSVTTRAYYIDPNPISNFQNCGSGSIGGSGGDDRFKGYLPAPISILNEVNTFVLSDGNDAKSIVYEGYQYAFDLMPNFEFAINNFKKVLLHTFSQEDFAEWNVVLPFVNSQLIETLKEGIEERKIDVNNNSELIMDVLAIQDKLMLDFLADSQNYSGFQLAKAEIQRLINDYQGAFQSVSEIDLEFSPTYQKLKQSYNCMLLNEINSDTNFNVLLTNNYGLGCFSEIEFENMEPFIDTINNQGERLDSNTIIAQNLAINYTKIYPIPASNQLFISLNSGKNIPCNVEIIDNLGRSIRNYSIILHQNLPSQINTSILETGIYNIKLKYLDKDELHKVLILNN